MDAGDDQPDAGSLRSVQSAAREHPRRGVEPFSIPVNAEDTCCSANGNMLSGNAIQKMPSSAIFSRSSRAIGARAAGTQESAAKPTAIRMNVTPFGAIACRPSAMNRNEAPQMIPGRTRTPQSTRPGVLAPAPASAAGDLVVPAHLKYQACDESVCYPPAKADAQWTLAIKP